jgi:6-phosphofructokinase 1
VDIEEAYQVGRKAVEVGVAEGSGWMATILRESDSPYRVRYDKVPLVAVAASARQLPAHWISADGLDVSDEFVRYARPLIGEDWPEIPIENGLQRFTRLRIRFIDKKLPEYVPVRLRSSG